MWRNSEASFGRVTRILHWSMALLILSLLALGLTLSDMQPALSNLWLYGLHKSLGFVALILVLTRLIWHLITPPPRPIGNPAALPQRIARTVHAAIYALLVVIPLAGWVGSSATGIDTVIFGSLILPPIAPVSEAWDQAAFTVHESAAWTLMVLLALHVAGAVLRAVQGDRTLRRMISGS
jgi:cytochrome b561